MRNKSLIHTKDVKTQEGTPLHLEYYLINDSVLGGCASAMAWRSSRRPARRSATPASRASPCAGPSIFTLIDQLALLRRHAGFAE